MELFDYLPIAVMVVLGVGFAAASLLLSRLVSPSKPTPEKLAPYESGIVPEVEPVERFPVKFYLVAMLFVIFDIEIIFLFAWATRFNELGWVGVGTIAVFVALAIETLVYVWKRGALDWNPPRRERYVREREEAA
jgi:NADH-quinone oxidoreductase subunit A